MAAPGSRASTGAARPNQREQAAAEARTRILAAAADRIVHDGLAQVRMASIARTAGVSAGLLHYHFDTKELLFGEVLKYSHELSAQLNERALASAGDGPPERLSSFLDRCLPSDQQRADEWLLWQELTLLCVRDPRLAKVGADLYEDLYATVADIVAEGIARGVFATALDPRFVAETAVSLTDGLGGRVLAGDPNFGIEEARTAMVTAVGILVGHNGPLPPPTQLDGGDAA
ncbi:TetR/AcrR family transcriptional regulator [Nocardioides caldifontis]|uniref:TetR/AcrR family transcriptional regulator n=1 Tax=Nocardioides caldifontis TaxID=2588938 RepID=UPI0011DFB433|nr:TetR family transcriptional regulator C-terminal domain-containing protein [Nocardioides caldifontis]